VPAQGAKLEIGDLVDGRYRVERLIGEGGMGVVFAARHVELDEIVAVKVLHPSAATNGENLERFLREARLAAKIKNEHVVRVQDVARGRGRAPPYIVMEYLEGTDLAEVVRARGPLPSTEAVDYILQACEAVAEAHQLGIVHRDLKPSNLLLTRRSDGSPLIKVLDFGISKTHDDDDRS
jgi:serine/threonine protein kinase